MLTADPDAMNLRQIETFYWAAKLGSFSAAADRLNATQSTVSMRIQDLERDFGLTLFDRGRRGARITATGREMMRYAEEVLRLSAEMRERLAGSGTMPGVLRIGVVEMISVTWLPRLVKAIHERYPKVALELDEALTQDLVEDLNQGNLDLILAAGKSRATISARCRSAPSSSPGWPAPRSVCPNAGWRPVIWRTGR